MLSCPSRVSFVCVPKNLQELGFERETPKHSKTKRPDEVVGGCWRFSLASLVGEISIALTRREGTTTKQERSSVPRTEVKVKTVEAILLELNIFTFLYHTIHYFRYHILVVFVFLIFFCNWKMPYNNASAVGGQPGT
jgi:hypothetical protein